MDNDEAIGYMLMACKSAGISKQQARKIYAHMMGNFDLYTETEAEKNGHRWLKGENDV